jgi:transposase
MAMTNIAEIDRVVTGGVDTHKDFHVAAALDQLGQVIGTQAFAATAAGYVELRCWLEQLGTLDRVGVEGTSSYGKNLTRSLTAANVTVCEVLHQDRARRRRHGKSDHADAIAAARSVQAGDAEIVPKSDGPAEQIRVLRMVYKGFVKVRTMTANQIHSIIDTAPETIRAELIGSSMTLICKTISTWNPAGDPDDQTRFTLLALVEHWNFLNTQINLFQTKIDKLVTAAAPPQLLDQCGVGPDVAAAILVAVGANPERFTTEAGFAALAGVSPISASSGRQQNHHRLNRGGNRDLNNALWRITIVRLRYDPRTQAYMTRRLTEGKTKRHIIRCLKRHIARQIWKTFQHPQQPTTTT